MSNGEVKAESKDSAKEMVLERREAFEHVGHRKAEMCRNIKRGKGDHVMALKTGLQENGVSEK